MRTMAEQGLLLALGLALAVLFASDGGGHGLAGGMGPMDAVTVAGLLAALSVAALADWLGQAPWACAPTAAYALLAVAAPSWMVFLPSVAYASAGLPVPDAAWRARRDAVDAPGRPAGQSPWPYLRGLACRWLWVVPLAASPWPRGLVDAPVRIRHGIGETAVVAGIALLGFALGRRAARERDGRRRLRAVQDRAREAARSSRLRLTDLEEERAQSVRVATLGERTRIAREIHDNVGHLLTRAIMQAQAGLAVSRATDDTVAARGFADLGSTLDDAMTMVRRSVHDLEDEGTDFAAQIDTAAHAFDSGSLGLHVRLANDITAAPAPVSRCLATVIREALANVAHHSEAHEATVTLRDFPAFWQLTVQDTGPARPSPEHGEGLPRGMGIADIESRVRSIGGVASCGPHGDGWRVFVSVPKRPWSGRTVSEPSESANRGNHENRNRG